MSRYVTPLPAMFARTVHTTLNRLIELDPAAPALLAKMTGKTLKVELQQLNLDLYFHVHDTLLQVAAESLQSPDTTIRGTPLALFALAAPAWKATDSGVTIAGDAELARDFEQLLRQLQPDWEAAWSERFGDYAGHQIQRFLRSGGQMLQRAAAVGTQQFGSWLGEESGLLVNRHEFNVFVREIDALRESFDRLEQAGLQRDS